VEQQGKKTWSFYRYSLTIEYQEKPLLAPPLIVINLLWRCIKHVYDHGCCTKKKTSQGSCFLLYITSINVKKTAVYTNVNGDVVGYTSNNSKNKKVIFRVRKLTIIFFIFAVFDV